MPAVSPLSPRAGVATVTDDDFARVPFETLRERLARDLAGVPDQDLKMRLAELIAHREQCCAEEQDCIVWGDLADLQWVLARRAEHAGAADEAP